MPQPPAADPAPRQFQSFSEITSFVWSVADLLRGDYKQSDYGKVILPFTVLRRLDCVLADTKDAVLKEYEKRKGGSIDPGVFLKKKSGVGFYNTSKLDFAKLKGDADNIARNLNHYIKGFSEGAREVIDRFKFADQIAKLDEANLLYQVVKKFAEVDLHPDTVPNELMGRTFEELIRRFAELSNETAGEHFTPREVIRLMVNLLFIEDDDVLRKPGVVRTIYDPAAGTGGMLSIAEEYLKELNPGAKLEVFGQELNDESFAICRSDMMLKGQTADNIKAGNSFSNDGHRGLKFDYMLSNPPFGVEWKKVETEVRKEHEEKGFAGRFGPGLPRINDGSLLFLLHMASKMKPPREANGDPAQGTRLCIVLNGSPLFTGDAGSGESEIRRWLFENDMLEAIIGLPEQLFYNTGISTYVWVVTNKKPKHRKGKVQLINGTGHFQKMKKGLGNKRNELSPEHIKELSQIFGDFQQGPISKIFDNEDFGFRRITVDRPLRLNFQVSDERLERFRETTAFQGLAKTKKKGKAGEAEVQEGRQQQAALVAALQTLPGAKLYKKRDAFEKDLTKALKTGDVKATAPLKKAILAALSEPDETADVCLESSGKVESNPDLRDYENVPLREEAAAYMKREVLPHAPDAWVDESKTKVGYEIPFTRHFYEYKHLRSLTDIEGEIRGLELEIQSLLGVALG
jgi:type I restriction enzyme M protein